MRTEERLSSFFVGEASLSLSRALEVVLVTDLIEACLRENIFNLGHPMYECNFRLDQHTFNVNARVGAPFRGQDVMGV